MMRIYFPEGKKVNVDFEGFTIKTDQTLKNGGDNTAPNPFQIFLAAIGSCAGYYVKQFCDARNINTDEIELNEEFIFDKNHEITEVQLTIMLPNDFPMKYKNAIVDAANQCAVKKQLQKMLPVKIDTEVYD